MFAVTLKTSSEAFDEQEGNPGKEIARILRKIADRVEDGVAENDYASALDLSGNTVGSWCYSPMEM